MAIMQAMDIVPALCCTCRFGTMIPAMVAATRTSVFWCRQGVPRMADRRSCPCYVRGSPLDGITEQRPHLRVTAPATTLSIDRPAADGRASGDADPPTSGWGGALTPSG